MQLTYYQQQTIFFQANFSLEASNSQDFVKVHIFAQNEPGVGPISPFRTLHDTLSWLLVSYNIYVSDA